MAFPGPPNLPSFPPLDPLPSREKIYLVKVMTIPLDIDDATMFILNKFLSESLFLILTVQRNLRGGRDMKKRNLAVFILVICVSVLLVTMGGCAKKAVKKAEITGEEPPAVEQQVPLEDQAAKEQVAREQALREQALREQALREEALGEQALKEQAAKEQAPTVKEEVKLEDIHFDLDKSNLTPEARKILERHADWLAKHEDCNLLIEGHCDERGTTEYNLALGERRAASAAKYLTDLGIDKARIETISYGEERPLDPGHNEEAWAKNRRAHFVVISE